MNTPLTLNDYIKSERNRNGLFVALCSWTPSFLGQNHDVLFRLFGKEVTLDDLYSEGCITSIRQNRKDTSLKITHFHSEHKIKFTFKVPNSELVKVDYMDWSLSEVICTFTKSKFFDGMMPMDAIEAVRIATLGSYGNEMVGVEQKINSLEAERKDLISKIDDMIQRDAHKTMILNDAIEERRKSVNQVNELISLLEESSKHDHRYISQTELLNIFNNRLEMKLGKAAYKNRKNKSAKVIDINDALHKARKITQQGK